jgi:proton-translocating NADH-quinone oxidoreductase chain M
MTLICPLIGAIFVFLLPKGNHGAHSWWALFFSLFALIFSLGIWMTFDGASTEPFQKVISLQSEWKGLLWLSFEFGIDGLSLWMILLTTALFPICILCSWQSQWRCSQEFMILLLLLESMLLATWTILDLLTFYVLYESILIPMFLLIGLGGSRNRKIRAAYQLVLYTLFGSLFMLPCLLFIYSETGTTNLELLYHYQWSFNKQLVLWWGFFFAFAVKIPMVPLHLWLPEAHVEASTAGSVLLAGVLLKLGSYGFLRFCIPLFPEACHFYSPWVITLSLIALIYTSLTTLRQVDLKKIIAYSSIAHMNMVMLSLFSLNDLGTTAAMFMMLSHGVVSPALFLCVGALYDRYHTKLLKYLGGCANTMPLFSLLFFIFSLANMALPLFPNFIAEFLTLCGIFSFHTWAMLLACTSMVLSAAYSLWAYARVVHGLPKPQYVTAMCDLCRREFWTFIPIILICLWWGFKPQILFDSMTSSIFLWQQLCQRHLLNGILATETLDIDFILI